MALALHWQHRGGAEEGGAEENEELLGRGPASLAARLAFLRRHGLLRPEGWLPLPLRSPPPEEGKNKPSVSSAAALPQPPPSELAEAVWLLLLPAASFAAFAARARRWRPPLVRPLVAESAAAGALRPHEAEEGSEAWAREPSRPAIGGGASATAEAAQAAESLLSAAGFSSLGEALRELACSRLARFGPPSPGAAEAAGARAERRAAAARVAAAESAALAGLRTWVDDLARDGPSGLAASLAEICAQCWAQPRGPQPEA